ncbi:hypothetical protein RKD19_004093 [Streptomyces canus]
MTFWLRATVLAIVVGASAVVLPQAGPAHGAEPTPPGRRAAHAVLLHGPPGTAASPATRSPEPAPARGTPHKAVRPHATALPPHSAPSPSAAPSGIPSSPAPAHASRHPGSDPARGRGPERTSPSASLAPSPASAAPSRAGSRAGEGRQRPGRPEEPETPDEEGTASAGTGTEDDGLTAVSEPPARTAAARPSPVAQRPVAGTKVFILPLGTGLVLVGAGLGLGLFALRLRRG